MGIQKTNKKLLPNESFNAMRAETTGSESIENLKQ